MYHTGIGGTIQSYNWQGGEQIHGSKWTTCIRREDGYCLKSLKREQTLVYQINARFM